MKIAIITYPFNANYGGMLQNYALQAVLKDRGHDVVTLLNKKIVPIKWYMLLLKIPFRLFKKYIFNRKDVVVFQELKINKEIPLISKKMMSFVKKNIHTREFSNIYKEIKPVDYDAFIVGSDQVWSPTLSNLYNYYLDFTRGWDVRRIAYASSFGYDIWNYNKKQTVRCKLLIRNFNSISVRETSAVGLCSKYFDIKPQWVLDPTLLLNSNRYSSLFKNQKHRDRYMFVFNLDFNSDKKDAFNKISQRIKLEPFSIYNDIFNSELTVHERIQPEVETWLSSIANADFVFTDSFHGMVFSIIFHKQFIAYSNRGAARFESLLKKLGLNNRLILKSSDINDACFEEIDYNKVDILLENYKKESLIFLDKALC